MEIDNYITGILDSTVHPDCPNCGKLVLHTSKDEKGDLRLYCNESCYREWRDKGYAEKYYCELCGDECSWRSRCCLGCHDSRLSNHFNTNEIVELVLLNKSCGLDFFVQNVWGDMSGKARVRLGLHEFLTELGEFEKFDYIEHLQDPSEMDTVLTADYEHKSNASRNSPEYDNRTRYLQGQTRSTVSRGVQRKRIREGGETRDTSNSRAKIPPKFKWGRFESKVRVILLKLAQYSEKTELTPTED